MIIFILYLFLAGVTGYILYKLDIGVSHYICSDDDYYGPIFGALFWPIALIGLLGFLAAKKVYKLIEDGLSNEQEVEQPD